MLKERSRGQAPIGTASCERRARRRRRFGASVRPSVDSGGGSVQLDSNGWSGDEDERWVRQEGRKRAWEKQGFFEGRRERAYVQAKDRRLTVEEAKACVRCCLRRGREVGEAKGEKEKQRERSSLDERRVGSLEMGEAQTLKVCVSCCQ